MMIVTADDSWAARDRAILETITCDEGIFAAGIRKAATLRPLSPETASRLVPWFSATLRHDLPAPAALRCAPALR
jgi:hypothetical protein